MMGRPFNQSTPLGRIMYQRGISVKQLEHATGISYRTISDYLAGRKPIIPKHIAKFSAELDLPREVLVGEVVADEVHVRAHAGKLDTGALMSGVVAALESR